MNNLTFKEQAILAIIGRKQMSEIGGGEYSEKKAEDQGEMSGRVLLGFIKELSDL